MALVVTGGVAVALLAPQPSGAPNDPQFEVEGNLLSETAGMLDWATGAAGTGVIQHDASVASDAAIRNADGTCGHEKPFQLGGPGVAGNGTLICDGSAGNFADQNGFTTGSHEETGNNPQPWNIKPASSPKKADLAEVYVYGKVFHSPFDTTYPANQARNLMFTMDLTRLDTSGDTHADFEFNQQKAVAPGSPGCPTTNVSECQPRTDNDVIVSFDLAQGGANPTTTFYRFFKNNPLPSGAVCADTPQASIASGGCYVQEPAPAAVGGEPAAFAVLNTSEIPAPPWKTVGCAPTTDNKQPGCALRSNIPTSGNMEAFIDLTAFFGTSSNFSLCPGFAQVQAKTRSSNGLNASLQDTSAPTPINASVCGSLLIDKFAADGTTPLPGASFTITPNPITRAPGSSLVVADGSALDKADGNNGVVCIDQVLPGPYSITETVVPDTYFGDTSTATPTVSTTDTCASRLGGTPTADASFTNTKGTITIAKKDGAGNFLGGATFTIQPNPLTGATGSSLDITDNGTNDAFSTTDGLICIDAVVNLANTAANTGGATSFTVTEKTPPPGFFGDSSSKNVSVTAPSTCAGRSTAAGGDVLVTPDVSFTNLKASLAIEKLAKNKNCTAAGTPAGCTAAGTALFSGATFTITPNPLTGTGSLDVTDNGANDAFSTTGGMLCIDGVVNLGAGNSYSIVEKASNNTNYTKDSSTKTVLSSALSTSTCSARSVAAGGDASVTPDVGAFVNTPLSQIELKFNSSAGPGVTQATTMTCAPNGGATITPDSGSTANVDQSYSGLAPGTYNCTVVVDP
jgi:hypothetical protein